MSDDEQDYEFEYSDDEQGGGGEEDDAMIKAQNAYYGAKGARDTDVSEAVAGFREVLSLAEGKPELSELGFKALKNVVKLAYRAGDLAAMLADYRLLLDRVNDGSVTRNKAEKAINGILDLVSAADASAAPVSAAACAAGAASSSSAAAAASGAPGSSSKTLADFYTVTLDALQRSSGNSRLSFKTRLKLARLYLARADWAALRDQLAALEAAVASERGAAGAGDDVTMSGGSSSAASASGGGLLEVYALQIGMFTALKDIKRLSDVYAKAKAVAAVAVPHPGITGAINECGGKLAMKERDWEASRILFLDAFKAYEEAGNGDRTLACLQYMLLANMLSSNRINPFDSQETKAYEKDRAITVMTQLTDAYLANDITSFDKLLATHGASLHADDFISSYIADLHATIRAQVAVTIVAPYTRVRLSFLASELGVTVPEAEALAVKLILDGQLTARIDQVRGILEMTATGATGAGGSAPKDPRYIEVERLASRLQSLVGAVATAAVTPAMGAGIGGFGLLGAGGAGGMG